jgi:hypothetical protein
MAASSATVIAPIVSALKKATEKIGGNEENLMSEDYLQHYFLEDYYSKKDQMNGFRQEELLSWASQKAEDLNAILLKKGFFVRLEDMTGHELGIITAYDLEVELKKAVQKHLISAYGNIYPAIKMEAKNCISGKLQADFRIFVEPDRKRLIACLETKKGDQIYMTAAEPLDNIYDYVGEIESFRRLTWFLADYRELVFPMINFCRFSEIFWIEGMKMQNSVGFIWRISQAFQHVRFRMNELGAKTESKPARSSDDGSARNKFVIDQPFYLWMERPGLPFPIIYAYFDTDAWKIG